MDRKIHNAFHASLLKSDDEHLYDRNESPAPTMLVASQETYYDVGKVLVKWIWIEKSTPSKMERLRPSRKPLHTP